MNITLLYGEQCLVDDEDYNRLISCLYKNHSWYLHHGYARAVILYQDKPKQIYIHRVVFNALDNQIGIDHINQNKLDNRKSNLRYATHSQNAINNTNTNPDRGISFMKKRQKWMAWICIAGKMKNLGLYFTKEEALLVRLEAEKLHYKDFNTR